MGAEAVGGFSRVGDAMRVARDGLTSLAPSSPPVGFRRDLVRARPDVVDDMAVMFGIEGT